MKRILLIAVLNMLSCFFTGSYAQSVPNTFFGIKLGEKITEEDISQKIGKQAVDADNLLYFVPDVNFNGKMWDKVAFVPGKDGLLVAVTFLQFTNYTHETPADVLLKDTEYIKLVESLGPREQLISDPTGATPTLVSLPNLSTMTMASVQFSDAETDSGTLVKAINLTFADLKLAMEFSQDLLDAERPEIQDTFFGIQLGSKPTLAQVKTAVGTRGRFIETSNPVSPQYTFRDVYFAGKRWDYAVFYITPKGQFFQFDAYDSYPDNSWNTDERQMANSTYEDVKSRLDSKYGEKETRKDEDGIHVIYLGKGQIGASLSNERGVSVGGDYRRYVKISYFDNKLQAETYKSSDDEL